MDDDGEHLNSYKQSSYRNSAPHYQRRPHVAPNHGITRPRQTQPLWTQHATNIRAPPMPGGSKNLQFGQSPTGTSNSKHHRTFRKAPQESKIHATRGPTGSRNIQGQAVNATQSNSTPSGSLRPRNQSVQNNQPVQRATNISSSGNQKRKHPLETLQEIAKSNDILAEINNKKNFFDNLFKSSTTKQDIFVLIVEILAKTSESSFNDLKLKMILHVANSLYITQLRTYIMDLPYYDNKSKEGNRLYWENPTNFWKNLLKFLECLINLSPSTFVKLYRSLLCNTIRLCWEELEKHQGYSLPEEHMIRFTELQNKLMEWETKNLNQANDNTNEEKEPPDDFRLVPVIPNRYHLMRPPFLRPNIVDGAYKDVDHYLDIQFRLMLEDCYGPLREGIIQYLDLNRNKRKYDNIRVYNNVKLLSPYVSANKIGLLVQVDKASNRWFFKINWKSSKRMLFGSLLLFSKDDFKQFAVATIIDRDVACLSRGQLPIAMANQQIQLNPGDSYTMIESEVYFEPYYHVLNVLQSPTFAQHLAMQKYIVKAESSTSPPEYVKNTTQYNIIITKTDDGNHDLMSLDDNNDRYLDKKFIVLNKDTWPNAQELGFNNSQYEAFQLALTNEIAVIQGPPGTGKTYLGVKIAETLLKNSNKQILVICYTNHALDQFLEHMLKFTQSIVRIGGQSRNEALAQYNINKLRTKRTEYSKSEAVYYEQKRIFQRIVSRLKKIHDNIQNLNYSILTYDNIKVLEPESQILKRHYGSDPLHSWLFEHMTYVEATEEIDENVEISNNVDEDVYQRVELNLDDDNFLDDNAKQIEDLSFTWSFSLAKAQKYLNYLKYQKKIEGKSQNYYKQLDADIIITYSSIALFNDMKRKFQAGRNAHKLNERNVKSMPAIDRWNTYFTWIENITLQLEEQALTLQNEYEKERNAYEDARMYFDLLHMRRAEVIGITTTGAARLHKMLQNLQSSIVIVEEAAEVLEQHIVAALSSGCQHLILIGDHQQLRPSASYIKLAKHYGLEVSLFERMIKNQIPNRRLDVQHRMRPEIASLIVPHIYPDLKNHSSVMEFLPVRGMTNNLFFFTHNYKEEEIDDSNSHTNRKEADLALGLANYLMQQDYNPEDITILAAYSGQMFYMRKQRELYHFLSRVKITVVDNYQGEEAKIIILSLVRNNIDNKVGFLSIENRVCVALSRAREGMYIFGNIDILRNNSDLWCKIGTTLENNGSLGPDLKLQCESHRTITTILKLEDFESTPEGGCLLECDFTLNCGHRCPLVCHGYDRSHLNSVCNKMCERTICELEHACPLPCKEKCSKCNMPVKKRLPCGHDMIIPCWQEPNEKVNCITLIPVTLPHCGHEVEKYCYKNIDEVECPIKCTYRVESCGHVCTRFCHVKDDPNHEKYVCKKPCARAKAGCSASLVGNRGNHQCLKQCHETCDNCDVEVKKKRSSCTHSEKVACCVNVDDTPCRKKCARRLPCGHHCKKLCFEECGNCNVKVTKVIPECGHEIKIECQKNATRMDCSEKCTRILPCGHICPSRCNMQCDPAKCTALVSYKYRAPCGHLCELPCNVLSTFIKNGAGDTEILLKYCTAPCNQTLECDHICSGTCSECYQGRIHKPCQNTCHRQIICGHTCENPCNKLCPPCKMKCEIRCPHSQCGKPCGAPCTPCQEKCERSCPHSACRNRCGERCSRAPCNEKCSRQLACGHPCRGLCGERCPDICAHCRPDTFPRDFLGDEFDEDAKFVQLEDCPHVLEVDDMDNLMMGDSESIAIRTCPFCRKPIINTQRYKDLINHLFVTDINPIKKLVFGDYADIDQKRKEISELIIVLNIKYEQLIMENIYYQRAFEKGKLISKATSLLDLNMKSIYFEILDIMGEYYMAYKNKNITTFEKEVHNQMEFLCHVISNNVLKISRQQQDDIRNELKRLNSIVQLTQIMHHPNYLTIKNNSSVIEATTAAKKAIITKCIFNNDAAKKSIENLNQVLKSNIITIEERNMVVKAMNMRAGHWYKCPNGHYYCIGECGGAMQIGKCNECGAQIGGQSHKLLSSNKHAGELDGSKFAAWSDQYNNMGNFLFD